jgi:hypothetical protein
MATPGTNEEGLLYYLAAAGALIGLGKLLVSSEPLTARKAIGHAIVSGGLGGAAALIQIPLPNAPFPVVVAFGCLLASLGASTITLFAQKYMDKKL